MTVLLVLEFKNEEQAQGFAAHQNMPKVFEWNLIGAYKKPEDHCKCGTNRPTGWTRGPIYGWWVCSRCRKMSYTALKNFGEMGINLLPNEILPEQYQHDEHSKYEWELDGVRQSIAR